MGNVHSDSDDDEVSQNSSGESDYEMVKTSLNGELYVLFEKHTPKQFRENLNKMIELLSRKIHLMQTHSRVLFDMHVLCLNVQKMEKTGLLKKSYDVQCDSTKNTDAIEGDMQLVQSIKELITVLNYFEQNGVPDFTSTRLHTFGEYVHQLCQHYDWEAAEVQSRDPINIEKLKEFRKHEEELKNIFHREVVCHERFRNGMHITNIQLIKRYITNINRTISYLKQPDSMDEWMNKDDVIEHVEINILEPGCEMFYMRRGAMTHMEILTQLKMKAENLLRNETMIIEWEKHQQEKKIWMDATGHLYPTKANKSKANKAKALLTSVPSITSEERAEMLARGGIMKTLVDALAQPPSQMHPPELAHLKSMISKRRVKDAGSRRMKRRSRRKKSRKNKHSI